MLDPVFFPQRSEIVLPDPIPSHPLLTDRREIGRGEHSIVIDHEDDERVYKLLTSPADYLLHTADDRPQGKHFPQLHVDHGIIGAAQSGYPIYLLELEKLYPLLSDSSAARLAQALMDAYWSACQRLSLLGTDMGRIALRTLLQDSSAFGRSVHAALLALADFIDEYQLQPDLLRSGNLMMRKDGCLVFADPVFIA